MQTYRSALMTYRRLLEAQQKRGGRRSALVLPLTPVTHIVPPRQRLDGLTRREREVAMLIARGYTNQQIAETLVLTRGTVANHVAHILGKVGLTNRTQVAARVLEDAPPGKTA